MNEGKIRELFDLCVRVSKETSTHVSFEYMAKGDESAMFIYMFNKFHEIMNHFCITQFYDFDSENQNYENAKKYLLELLINGRCPLNET